MKYSKTPKVLIIGLDSAAPQLIFDKWKDDLPNFKSIMENGIWGELRSCIPPITVPAWAAMMTSKDPGQLGLYGFRNRRTYGYDSLGVSNAFAVQEPTLWDILSEHGKRCIAIGVPPTYPPKPINGIMVGCFLTPNKGVQFTYPEEIKAELDAIADGNYMLDVENFRTDDKQRLLNEIVLMTQRRFKVVKKWIREKPWEFFISVEIGLDRIHHGFWKYHDPEHPKYEQGNKFENAIHDYYRYIDKELGEIVDLVDENTILFIVSDHGAKKLDGGICINEWLRREGLLVLNSEPIGPVRLEPQMIDWSRTRAWAEGGYYARVFLNVQGREPNGNIPRSQYEIFRDQLVERLRSIPDHNGRELETAVLKPETIYRVVSNIPPDLLVLFGNLSWRSVGIVGTPGIHTFENDTGPDDANHDYNGIFIMRDHGISPSLRGTHINDLTLYDVAPTVLRVLGCPIPRDMIGKVIPCVDRFQELENSL